MTKVELGEDNVGASRHVRYSVRAYCRFGLNGAVWSGLQPDPETSPMERFQQSGRSLRPAVATLLLSFRRVSVVGFSRSVEASASSPIQ